MTDLARHRIDIARAIADGNAGRDEVFRHLLELPPDERAKRDPALFARLTEAQLRKLMGEDEVPVPTIAPPTAPKQHFEWRWWPTTPLPPLRTALATALVVTVLGGAGVVGAIALAPALQPHPVRTLNANTWPACPRLATDTDACVYAVQERINLAAAANDLAMPVEALQAINPNLPSASTILPARTRIVVWRGQGTLTP